MLGSGLTPDCAPQCHPRQHLTDRSVSETLASGQDAPKSNATALLLHYDRYPNISQRRSVIVGLRSG
jgi:hypothetical protein